MHLNEIKESDIRRWRYSRLRRKQSCTQVPKAYRLMRAVLNTAVKDKLIRENPCQIDGAGLEDVHLHDLRHTGNTFAAEAGASLRELMNRIGHSSPRAAMIYLHARDERAQELADRLGERAAEELRKARGHGGDDEDDPPLAGARV
ncbi:tyrosine-type recombinase/integrase [Nocardiopsis sp. N85]|uniref:tyrosine-type recombinase/integrase n=1 Tax=Nocardiopsis sp. N85 TaxID=3029400 RepID=UPI00237FC06D|nr:tyrosine-type recombinase/integrase [Nocardiopsis sp. N85]MDE3724906.1 tyrosine-type recombinase/integrase [Nocardiopsis sp. N85]